MRPCVLELNPEKTNIVHVEQGFNFLGFNIRQFKGSCFTIPQKEKVKEFLQGIRDWLKANPSHKPEAVIAHLNPLLRGYCWRMGGITPIQANRFSQQTALT